MTVAPEILKHYPDLNEAQRRVVAHQEGPLLVIAGPGSGKTYSIVLRALNLLLRFHLFNRFFRLLCDGGIGFWVLNADSHEEN